jgi:hypothetical protein
MKRLLLGMIGSVFLAGCQTFAPTAAPAPKLTPPTPTALAAPRIAAIQSGVRASLKNPKTASFRNSSFQAVTSLAGVTTACGYVRPKNAAADEPFLGTFSGRLFTVSSLGDSAATAQSTLAACQTAGIVLPAPSVSSKPAAKAKAAPAPKT